MRRAWSKPRADCWGGLPRCACAGTVSKLACTPGAGASGQPPVRRCPSSCPSCRRGPGRMLSTCSCHCPPPRCWPLSTDSARSNGHPLPAGVVMCGRWSMSPSQVGSPRCAHHLTALTLSLESALRREGAEARADVEKAQSLARGLLADVREIVADNEPVDVEASLKELATNVPRPRVHLQVEEGLTLSHVILRCAQEIVTNALTVDADVVIAAADLLRVASPEEVTAAPSSTHACQPPR